MKCHWHLWFLVSTLLLILVAACRGGEETETAVCNFTEQTAVTVNLRDESNQPLRLVTVRYKLDDGLWQTLPERVNDQAQIKGGPGTYQIRAEKPGYTAEEMTVTVAEQETDSCQLEAQEVTLPLTLAVCPDTQPAVLEIEIDSPGEAVEVTAVSPQGDSQSLACDETNTDSCAHYSLPINSVGRYALDITGLDGVGPMLIANQTISYTLTSSQITLRQNAVTHHLSTSGANEFSLTIPVMSDEIGCPLVDFRSLMTEVEPDIAEDALFPGLTIAPQNNLTMTDLGAEACQAPPEPYSLTYEAMFPIGTPIEDAGVFTLRDGEWQEASCELLDGRFLCTATYSNPLIEQPYAYKVVAGDEEYIGTSLPFDTLCLIFD